MVPTGPSSQVVLESYSIVWVTTLRISAYFSSGYHGLTIRPVHGIQNKQHSTKHVPVDQIQIYQRSEVNNMELQLALDLVDIPQGIALVKEVESYIDIVEIGTPIVINEGLHAVKAMKEAFPNLKVLADLKVMDAGGYEVLKASEAGADIVTILAVAEDATIKGAVEEAKKQGGKKILVDMIGVKNLEQRAKEIDALGVDYICVHTGYDLQAEGESPFEALQTVKKVVKNSKTAVAGGIKLSTLAEVVKAQPDLVIVGGGITGEDDKKAVASQMQQLIKQG